MQNKELPMALKLTLVRYEPSMSVGNEELDGQHARFFELLGDFGSALADPYHPITDPAERAAVLDLVGRLREYALFHFGTEERHMQECAFPGLDEQKRAHNEFIRSVLAFERDLEAKRPLAAVKIRDFIHDWYRGHILDADKKYAPFLTGQAKKGA
ncbi:bacteriohemerythrin [Desulfolutivibrio sulfodismutans DSM 3696]|nr:bacteriohemerythrin [Desulfolutivibrio sulfodismutans DSM 3696]